MTIVAKSTIDRKTGDLYMQVLPQEFDSRQKAHDAMREEYFKELKKLGLEDNDAMDETCEESCEGGYNLGDIPSSYNAISVILV